MAENDDAAGDAGKDANGKAAATPELAPEVQQQLDEMKKQLEQEKLRADKAEAAANAAARVANTAAAQAEETEMHLVTSAIDTVTNVISGLKDRLRSAHESNDYAAVADLQAEISIQAAKLVKLEDGKAAMEEERKNPRRVAPAAQPVVDPVEALARSLTPRSAAWVRAHPTYAVNPRLNRKMIRAHEDAIDDGLEPDTDEYFQFVEQRLGITGGNAAAGGGEGALSAAATGRQRSAGDAPPAGLPPARGGASGDRVRLTPEQREIARTLGMTDEEYATNLKALKAEGRIH